eukprot:2814733-Amphidinium_carterae.1
MQLDTVMHMSQVMYLTSVRLAIHLCCKSSGKFLAGTRPASGVDGSSIPVLSHLTCNSLAARKRCHVAVLL